MEKLKFLILFIPFFFFIAFLKNILISGFDIKDNVFTSYIIAPLLSLPFFIMFSFKETKENKKISFSSILALSSFLMLLNLILQIYLQIKFSYLYYTFRLDLLSIVFFVMIFYFLIFGNVNLKVVFFSLLSVPLFFLLFFFLGDYFNKLNLLFLYPVIKILNLKEEGIVVSNGSINIAIKEECTSPSVFLAFLIYIILVSYFFDGKKKDKLFFIIFSFLVLFFFNLLRISIILFFLSKGIIQHIGGVPFFYLGIAVAIFSFKKFKLTQPNFEIKGVRRERIILLLFFSLLFFFSQNPKRGLTFEELNSINKEINYTRPFLNYTGFSTERGFQFYFLNQSYILIAPHRMFESSIELLKHQFFNITNSSSILFSTYLIFENYSAEIYDIRIANNTFCAIFGESYSKKGFFSIGILSGQETNSTIKIKAISSYPEEYKKINNNCVILFEEILQKRVVN
ncbi:MAG: archaeosortase/exosortase family protein [Candidatus Micrarchaeales archaeon]|jgi:exosortase/archaeosortase family protein